MHVDPLEALPDQPTVTGGTHQPYAAWNQGWDAAERGYPRGLNPYRFGSQEHKWWG